MASTIKSLKEASVTGHSGSSHPWEVLWVCSSAVTGCAVYNVVVVRIIESNKESQQQRLSSTSWSSVILEALLVWFPMILAQSEYLYPYATAAMIVQVFVAGAGLLLLGSPTSTEKGAESTSYRLTLKDRNATNNNGPPSTEAQSRRLEYLTLYRSSILYLTFIAILAVDFPSLFPRRFCKTEEKGYGLMDVGAASFCISAGLVGAKHYWKRNVNNAATPSSSSSLASSKAWKSFLHALPLILIGLVRIITNKELEYQEHVTEYGVHWNFFFTLGVLAVIPAVVKTTKSKPTLAFPLLAMIVYQLALSLLDWQIFVEEAPRNMVDLQQWMLDTPSTHHHLSLARGLLLIHSNLPTLTQLFLANREGVLGCCGYLSLYYVGEWVGATFLWDPKYSNRSLWLFVVEAWGFHLALVYLFRVPVSRRSTNIGFCSWAVAHNILLLCLLKSLEKCIQSRSKTIVPLIWEASNRHGMVLFLVANLLTGLVNLIFPTLHMDRSVSLATVFGYICLVGLAAVVVDKIHKYLFKLKSAPLAPGGSKKMA